MLTVEDWAEIRRLHRAEGLPIKMIARVLGISKNTVKSALESNQQPKYERAPQGSIVDAVEPRIRELLQAYPTMPATVIAERIGWERSIRVLSARVAELRPVYLPPDPASRTTYVAGEIAQCDFWFPPIELPVGFGQTRTAKQLPVLTMVCAYSRWLLAMLLPSRCAEDLFAGWWRLIEALGAVPRVLVWDGEGAIGRWRGGRSELTTECQAFRGTLAAKVLICRPADPEAKGLIERAHDYLERSFLPGRVFASPADFNAQLGAWLALVNTRTRRALGCAPTDRIGADRLCRYPLLVVDEVGYIPFEPEAANLFFQLVSSRYERASLIVTSNKAFGRWGEVFGGDDVVAAAMIDRLVHHAEVVALKGDSYRLKDRDLGRVPPAGTTEE